MAFNSAGVRMPIFCSMPACAMEPRISWRQSRQSNPMDWVNWATSDAGPDSKRPLRETGDAGEVFFILKLGNCAEERCGSHAGKGYGEAGSAARDVGNHKFTDSHSGPAVVPLTLPWSCQNPRPERRGCEVRRMMVRYSRAMPRPKKFQ